MHPSTAVLSAGPYDRRARARGFTLVEMMIVVAIVAVLATLASVGYRKLVTSAHTAEATAMVQSIRAAQEAFRAEVQQYANVSPSLTTTYPAASPGTFVTAWGAPCGAQCNPGMDWSALAVHTDGPVMFGYATVAGPAGSTPVPGQLTVDGQSVVLPSPSPTDWFIVAARGDADGNGIYCTVYGTSWTNALWIDREGE